MTMLDQATARKIMESLAVPEPKPAYCCGSRLLPCKCGADVWKSDGDYDCGDWDEEQFVCQNCGNRIHIELPD